MSDFELAYLVNETLNAGSSRMIEFMTGLFAMLVGSYVAGPKLSRGVVWLMMVLFTMFAIATILPAVGTAARMAAIFQLVNEAQSLPGSELSWVTTPPFNPAIFPWYVAALLSGAYAGAIVFLQQMRNRDDDRLLMQ